MVENQLPTRVWGGDAEVVVGVHGEIDVATAEALWHDLAAVMRSNTGRLVLDLSGTEFVDSSGLQIFARAWRKLQEQGSELVLRGPQRNVRTVLRVSGFDQFITVEV